MTHTYCPACLDTFNIKQTFLDRGNWVDVAPGVHLHVSCGRALEALRTAPPLLATVDELEAAA